MDTTTVIELRQLYCSVREPADGSATSDTLPEVTAYSDGLTPAGAAYIAARCGGRSAIAPERRLTPEMTEANPYAVYDYAPRLSLRRVADGEGRELWAITRSVYLGDCTLTHIFLSATCPGPAVFASIERDGLWRPVDYSLADDSADLRDMRYGRSERLPVVSLTVEPMPMTVMQEVYELRLLMPALAEAERKRREKPGTKVPVVAARAAVPRIPAIVAALGALPTALTDSLCLTTGYTPGEAAADLRLVLTSDQSPDMPEGALTVDLISGADSVTSGMAVYDTALHLIDQADYASALSIIGWHITGDDRSDDSPYGAELYLAVNTPRPLDPVTVTSGFINAALAEASAQDETVRERLVSKILAYIDSTVASASKSSALTSALGAATALEEWRPGTLTLSASSADRLARLLIRRGTSGYLGRLADAGNVGAIAAMIPPGYMGSPERLAEALSLSTSPEVWVTLLRHYYGGDPSSALDAIMRAIASSQMSDADRTAAVTTLFPLADRATQLIDWYKANPSMISLLPGPVRSICLSVSQECFSRLLSGRMAEEACAAVGPLVTEYFLPRIEASADSGMEQLLAMLRRLRPDLVARLGVLPMIERYAAMAVDSPGVKTADIAAYICRLGLRLPDSLRRTLGLLNALLTGRVPVTAVTADDLELAARLKRSDSQLRASMFESWLRGAPESGELIAHLDKVRVSDPELIERMITAVWRHTGLPDDRELYIRAIVERSDWDSDERRAFAAECGDEELQKLLGHKKSLMSKLGRVFGR